MKFNTLIFTTLFNLIAVYAKSSGYNSSSFAVGSSTFCKSDDLSKIDKLYYASISKDLLTDETNCNNYVVAMVADAKSDGKYKLVKALIRDQCEDCSASEVRFSVKAIKDIKGSRKSNVFWAILSKEGEMINGPFQPTLSEKETQKIVDVYDGKNIDEVLQNFIDNAKYMILKDKTHLKNLKHVKFETVKKTTVPAHHKVVKTTVIKSVLSSKKVITRTKAKVATAASPVITPTIAPTVAPTIAPETAEEETTSSGSGIMTGAVAVSVAAGATLLLVHRKSAKKNYIFGEPIDKYDGNVAKELYAKTKTGQKFKLKIPYNDFNDIAHIQIYSPSGKESFKEHNVDIYNIHTERALRSSDSSLNESCSSALPLPQEQPKPHSQLPLPSNDFMMAFSPVEQPDLAAIPKENIGAYDCTKITTRFNDDPYLSQYKGDDNQEIYNSVPKVMNKTYANNASEMTSDILLEYVEGEEEY